MKMYSDEKIQKSMDLLRQIRGHLDERRYENDRIRLNEVLMILDWESEKIVSSGIRCRDCSVYESAYSRCSLLDIFDADPDVTHQCEYFCSGLRPGGAMQKQMRFEPSGCETVYTRCRNCGFLRCVDEFTFEWLRIFGCFRCGYDDFQILPEEEWNIILSVPEDKTDIPY